MGSNTTSLVFLIITFLMTCFAMMGLSAGLLGYSWWTYKASANTIDLGLWRNCVNDKDCTIRNNVFEDFNNLDIIMILLIASGFFGFISLTTLLVMFCCQNSPTGWTCTAILACLCSFVAGGSNMAGVIFAEIKFEDTWKYYDHGWSNICAWIGGVLFLLVSLFSLVLSCLRPKTPTISASYNQQNISPVYNPSFHNSMKDNQGYQRT